MAQKKSRIVLFNPYTLHQRETAYNELTKETGLSLATLSSYKTKGLLVRHYKSYLLDYDKITLTLLRQLADKVKPSDEVWVPIPGTNNKISNYGRIYSEHMKSLMIPFVHRSGYLSVRLKLNNDIKVIPVHRLVAWVFLEHPLVKCSLEHLDEPYNKHGLCVVHLNHDIYNNHVVNLKWVHKRNLFRYKGICSTCVIKRCPTTNEKIAVYDSVKEAAEEHYVHPNAIYMCINGAVKTSVGFKWSYEKP